MMFRPFEKGFSSIQITSAGIDYSSARHHRCTMLSGSFILQLTTVYLQSFIFRSIDRRGKKSFSNTHDYTAYLVCRLTPTRRYLPKTPIISVA